MTLDNSVFGKLKSFIGRDQKNVQETPAELTGGQISDMLKSEDTKVPQDESDKEIQKLRSVEEELTQGEQTPIVRKRIQELRKRMQLLEKLRTKQEPESVTTALPEDSAYVTGNN
jgi:hypothetical protein